MALVLVTATFLAPMAKNVKHGFTRLFVVLTLGWSIFWVILYPLHVQWEGQKESFAEHNEENKNCDALVAKNPEWGMTKNCYQQSDENYRNRLRFYSLDKFWSYPLVFWKLFLTVILLPPAIVYGLVILGVWIQNGFKPRASRPAGPRQ
jgi:hypothetical protein